MLCEMLGRHILTYGRKAIRQQLAGLYGRTGYCHTGRETQVTPSSSSCSDSARKLELGKVICEAERIVGYPTSLMYLRCLLSDEIADVAMHVRKLIGTKHPLLKTARGLLYGDKHGVQIRGLIVLLVSKAAMSCPVSTGGGDSEMISGITARQRALAEITEMIHTATLIHKGVVDMAHVTSSDGPVSDMEFGNKISVLSGDFLLANACTGLAQLQNTQVVETISTAIGDLTEAEFVDSSHNASATKRMRHLYLSSGSLFAKSCQSALTLTNHSTDLQKQAYEFGLNMAYALETLSATTTTTEKSVTSQQSSDASHINDNIASSHQSSNLSESVNDWIKSAKVALEAFHDSEAKSALLNIADAVTVNVSNDLSNET